MTTVAAEVNVRTASELLEQWQGHRRLTRRVIDAFPEDQLFTYSAGGMRPFAEMAWEFIKMTVPIARGVATGEWREWTEEAGAKPVTKAELLRVWDTQTVQLDESLPVSAGKVRVTVEMVAPTAPPKRSLQEWLEELRKRQAARGHVPMTAEEVQAYIKAERDSWED